MDWQESVRLIRLRLGLKQAALADMTGVGQSSISRWESGSAAPNLSAQRVLRELLSRAEMTTSRLNRLKHQVRTSGSLVLMNENAVFEEVGEGLCRRFLRDRSDVVGRRNDEHMIDDGGAEAEVCSLLKSAKGALSATIYNGGFDTAGAVSYFASDAIPMFGALGDFQVLLCTSAISKDAFDAFTAANKTNYALHHIDDLG